MPRAAVAVAASSDASIRARPDAPEPAAARLSNLGNQISYGRPFRPTRAHLGLLAITIFGIWLVIVFGGVLRQINDASSREQSLNAEAMTLQQRLDAGRAELQLVQTDSFQRFEARAYGLGAPGEIVFGLDPGAPSPESITPLGSAPAAATRETPLDAWLQLLFGS